MERLGYFAGRCGSLCITASLGCRRGKHRGRSGRFATNHERRRAERRRRIFCSNPCELHWPAHRGGHFCKYLQNRNALRQLINIRSPFSSIPRSPHRFSYFHPLHLSFPHLLGQFMLQRNQLHSSFINPSPSNIPPSLLHS